MTFVHTGSIEQDPFDFTNIRDYLKETYEQDISDSKNIVMVGDQLTSDILFGNSNEMTTVWVNKYTDTCNALNTRSSELYALE